ncbi:hypothetical protein ABIA96_005311 [Bradyrhizobium sp. LB11.1]
MFLQVAEGLLLCVEIGGKPAQLSICAEREKEGDRSIVLFEPRHDLHAPACDGLSNFRGRFRRFLSLRLFRAPLRRWRRRSCSKSCVSRFLGLAHFPKSRHVCANRDGLLFDLRQRLRSLFSSQAFAIGTRDTFR